MKKIILQFFRFIGAFIVGGLIGLLGATLIVVLFTETTFNEFITQFIDNDWGEIIGVAAYSLLCAVIAIPAHIILHEGGHLVAGLLSGYKFVSFRIGSFTLIRINNKLQIKKFSIAGTGGQCLMMPPQRPIDKIPTTLYNLGGVLANLVFSIIPLAFLPILGSVFAWIFIFIFAMLGVLLAIVNGIPMKVGGVSNDGNNVLYLNKNRKAKEAFVYQLITNALIQEGYRPNELSGEYLTFDTDIDYKDPLQVNHLLISTSTLLDKRQYEECYGILNTMMQHRSSIVALMVNEIACELVYTLLVTHRTDEARTLYDEPLQQYVEQHKEVMSAKQRLLCAKSYYLDNDHETAQKIYDSVCSHRNNYLMQGEVAMDIALMHEILFNKKRD